ncbi:hypothetical protein [Brevundimonas diminuta]|uniref:hypothetical protein n=1 Tax=Brevundimonas diminuta TaxID=293 RepID=UPI00320A68C6
MSDFRSGRDVGSWHHVETYDLLRIHATQHENAMSRHLPGKISRLIGDFATICDLVGLIEHELEKRILARHGLAKLDALLQLLPRLKNEIRLAQFDGQSGPVAELTRLIARLRRDYVGSDMETGRDAVTSHALKLDLERICDTWKSMGATTYGVLREDLAEIDAELKRLCSTYVAAPTGLVDPIWPRAWAQTNLLGPADQPRLATIYPGLATAGIVSPLPAGHPAQDAVIRAVGVATFIRQVRLIWEVVAPGSIVDRLLSEIALNDLLALWELLFSPNVRNEHGEADQPLLAHWRAGGWKGADCLEALEAHPHPELERWREHRNKFSAHVDPDEDIWKGDLGHWPMKPQDVFNEALRVVEAARQCAQMDVRSHFLFIPPSKLGDDVTGLAGQEGRHWAEA